MARRWIALGIAGFAVWLIATFGVTYFVIERQDDGEPSQAIVTGVSIEPVTGSGELIDYCVSYTLLGKDSSVCQAWSIHQDAFFSCYDEAVIGKSLPDSCTRKR